MSEQMPTPTVETVFYFKKYDFTLIVLAFRRVTPVEARRAYFQFLRDKKLKNPPRGITVRVYTLHGYDLE